jgi:hypothetical protein
LFENRKHKVIPRKAFVRRQLVFFLYGCLIIFISLFIGVAGYMYAANLPFVDATLNASMILAGMGPVDVMTTHVAKYFSSFYALYSGIVFLSTASIVLAPAVHRFLHIIHKEESN